MQRDRRFRTRQLHTDARIYTDARGLCKRREHSSKAISEVFKNDKSMAFDTTNAVTYSPKLRDARDTAAQRPLTLYSVVLFRNIGRRVSARTLSLSRMSCLDGISPIDFAYCVSAISTFRRIIRRGIDINVYPRHELLSAEEAGGC